jgi:DNA-binding CsgD family transcriptional regulator
MADMKTLKLPVFVVALIVVQSVSAIFFLSDVFEDGYSAVTGINFSTHLMVEGMATLGLIFGIIFEARYLLEILRRNAEMDRNMRVATGALNEVITEYFKDWALTPSEKDVAMFAIKGMSNQEIAGLRESSEGTIKAHLNAVFRKAGVSGRNQLISLLVEDLMAQPLMEAGQ